MYEESPSGKAIVMSDFNRKISQNNLELIVAERADFYYDYPTKVNTDERNITGHMWTRIDRELLGIKKDLILVSPYFIPSDELMEKLKIETQKGVNVVIITNSLASTDVFPVYSGYKDDIKPLVEMGVKLYEIKPDSFKSRIRRTEWANPNSISLHTKLIIFDDDRLGVGSANIDPRSSKLNTELFMIINSEKLTQEEKKKLYKVINLKNFYQLSWGEYPKEFDDDITRFGPIWHTMEEGKEKIYYAPPHVGFWKRLGTDIISLFPIRGYL